MKIFIRAMEERDLKRIAEIFDHQEVVPHSSQHPFLGYKKIVELFEKSTDNAIVLVAELDGEVEGYIKTELNTKPRFKHVAELSMAVHPSAQGKGVGNKLIQVAIDQADNWLNIVRLQLDVYSDNAKAISLYEKYGFIIEGVARLASYRNGELVDLCRMSRIEERNIQSSKVNRTQD